MQKTDSHHNIFVFLTSLGLLAVIMWVSLTCGLMLIKAGWCESGTTCLAVWDVLNVIIQSLRVNWSVALLIIMAAMIAFEITDKMGLIIMADGQWWRLEKLRRTVELRFGQVVFRLLLANRLSPKVY